VRLAGFVSRISETAGMGVWLSSATGRNPAPRRQTAKNFRQLLDVPGPFSRTRQSCVGAALTKTLVKIQLPSGADGAEAGIAVFVGDLSRRPS
jgi:hypothetical protein